MRFVNNAVFRIIYESEDVDNIMIDMLVEMPSIFYTLNFDTVKEVVVSYICDPKPFAVDTRHHRTFEKILKRHLDKVDRFSTKKSGELKMADKLRSQARAAMKGECKDSNFIRMLGCSQNEFRVHIESQFTDGMSWDTYGIDGWHIDHIEPLCSFDLKNPVEIEKATKYTNLRPLPALDNITKGRVEDKKKSTRKDRK